MLHFLTSSCIQLFSPNYTLPSVSCCRRKGPCTHLETLVQRTSKCSRTPTLWTSGFMAGAREMNEWGHMRLKGSFSTGKKIINIALLLVLKGSVKSLSVSITDTVSYFLWHEVSSSMLIALSFTNTFKLVLRFSCTSNVSFSNHL